LEQVACGRRGQMLKLFWKKFVPEGRWQIEIVFGNRLLENGKAECDVIWEHVARGRIR